MTIFTISRQMGTLGDPMARQLAERLNAPLLDREQIMADAGRYGFPANGELPLEVAERGPTLLERLRGERGRYTLFVRAALLSFAAEAEHAVVVGLGGQVFFEPVRHALRVLLTAPFETRVERVQANFSDHDTATRTVRQHDQERSGYHQYVHQVDWLSPQLYHLVVNTGITPIETSVELLIRTAELPAFQATAESRQDLRDRALAAGVEARLASSPEIPPGRVAVQAKDGVVTLSGLLDSPGERHRAEQIARETPGVIRVTSEINVLPPRTPAGV